MGTADNEASFSRWSLRAAPALAVAVALASPPVLAAPPETGASEGADRAVDEGEAAEAALDFVAAERSYARASESAGAGAGPLAAVARARLAYLRGHAEGDYVPLAELVRFRREADGPPGLDAAPTASPATFDRFMAFEARVATFPAGAVAADARLFLASAYLRRFPRGAASGRAYALLEAVVRDEASRAPHGLVHGLATAAADELVRGHLADGDVALAQASAARVGDVLGASTADALRRAVARRYVGGASWAWLALVLASALAAVARTTRDRRRLVTPARVWLGLPVAVGAYVAAAGGLLATRAGSAAPFVALGAALAPFLVMAAVWGKAGRGSPVARTWRALACAVGAVALAFRVLEAVDASYLADFGL